MRIVAGKFKGRRLAEPRSNSIRPTTDRARETLFNILAHGCHMIFDQARVLDLFAGTGALGIEALSRGAAFALFVDQSTEARGLIRSNMDSFGLNGCSKIYRRDATQLGDPGTLGMFDLALLDPPYGTGAGEAALQSLVSGGWLNPGALVVLEEQRGVAVSSPTGLSLIKDRAMADTQLLFYRLET